MISIDEAIEKSKELPNISDGGSECFDFGDTVLIRYTLPTKYVKQDYRARNTQESVMEGINKKASIGVNTPKHIAMKRVVEEDNDVCYVLQEKCKGKNCASMVEYTFDINKVINDLKYVCKIPYKHYKKLVSDSCMLYEMGYEAKNKNLFYDEETGFWFIDFLSNEPEKFDSNNVKIVFETIKYISPKPGQIVSMLRCETEISKENQKVYDELRFLTNAKYLCACKEVIPTFSKYEFFYLLDASDDYKKYLIDNKYVDRDLFKASQEDLIIYNELFQTVVNNLCDEISNRGTKYWDVEVNKIRNSSNLFSLQEFYNRYISNEPDEYKAKDNYTFQTMKCIYENLLEREENINITNFITEYKNKLEMSTLSK